MFEVEASLEGKMGLDGEVRMEFRSEGEVRLKVL